jgi:DNA-binding PadR family transcriptional regulator
MPRQFSNPLALAVLVFLFERPMHPYEMAATLRERHKEESIKLRYGSLYTVIERLVSGGLIRPRETRRDGNRPERTIYELTPAGEAEMREWMREILRTPVKEFPQFEAGLSLLPALPPEEAAGLLELRIDLLNKEIEKVNAGLREAKAMKLAPLFTIENEYRAAGLEMERDFVQDLVARIRKDGCGFREEWGKFHAQKAQRAKQTSRRNRRS